MPGGFTSPDPNVKQSGGADKKAHGAKEQKPRPRYPNTASFASETIPDVRTGGRSKRSKKSSF